VAKSSLLLLAFCLSVASATHAQSGTGLVIGTASDPSHAVLVGAKVVALAPRHLTRGVAEFFLESTTPAFHRLTPLATLNPIPYRVRATQMVEQTLVKAEYAKLH
jgi:hypothetical protein